MKYFIILLMSFYGSTLLANDADSSPDDSVNNTNKAKLSHEPVLEDYANTNQDTARVYEQNERNTRRSTRDIAREEFDGCDYDENHGHYHCADSPRRQASTITYRDNTRNYRTRSSYYNNRYNNRFEDNFALGLGIGLPILINNSHYRHNRHHGGSFYWNSSHRNYGHNYGRHNNRHNNRHDRHNGNRHHRHDRHCGH